MSNDRRLSAGQKNRRPISILIMDIIITILGVIFVFVLCFAIYSYFDEQDNGYKMSTMHYAMTSDGYTRLMEMSGVNRGMGIGKNDADYQEYYAVADYFEAEVYVRMYERAGDTERAEKWRAKEEKALREMGALGPVRERIGELLEQTEQSFGKIE